MQDFEASIRSMLFGRKDNMVEDVSKQGQRIYRRMIRGSMFRTIFGQLAHTKHLAGEETLRELVEEWLEQEGPKTRSYWQIPVQFSAWLMQKHYHDHQLFAEMAHFEAMLISAKSAPNAVDGDTALVPCKTYCRLRFHPSARLCIYQYPVFRANRGGGVDLQKSDTPCFILVYREHEDCNWIKIEPQLAQLLAKLDDGSELNNGYELLKGMYGQIDRHFLQSRLVDLAHRGAIVFIP